MGKLHELLSVESNLEAAASAMLKEGVQVFKNKENLFKGKVRSLKLFGTDESNRIEHEALEAKDSINQPVAATPQDNLNYIAVAVADYWDAVFQKEKTNQTAVADLVIDGEVIATGLPATFLLGLETKLKAFRDLVKEIPTRVPGVLWERDDSIGKNILKSPQVKDVKTAKAIDHKPLPQPNANIAVQYVQLDITKNIGEYTETQYTSLISSNEKARLLDKIDALIRGVKQARQRANSVDAVSAKVCDPIMKFVFGDWFNRESARAQLNK